MNHFIHEDFLLSNPTASRLYHDYAAPLPIIDYHNHLDPREISTDHQYKDLWEIWLKSDHYKWRALRNLGVEESFITGDKPAYVKFLTWAKAVPQILGNPLYHWTHLELYRYFNITDSLLNENTAQAIWKETGERLSNGENTAQGIIAASNVELLCTTDDPLDSLEYHASLAEGKNETFRMLPTFRMDNLLRVDQGKSYSEYLNRLEQLTNLEIKDFPDLCRAITQRHEYFHQQGCRLSDVSLGDFEFIQSTTEELNKMVEDLRQEKSLQQWQIQQFRTALLLMMGRLNHKRNWTMQLHTGALRNLNSRRFSQLGANSGYDSMNDTPMVQSLENLLNELDRKEELPRTILFTLNPIHYNSFATLAGCFQQGPDKGKIQLGAAWWFNDHKRGMIEQMDILSTVGTLSTFTGMLTDSRSLLSLSRHEYFRRILCDHIGGWVEKGEAPEDYKLLGEMVENICYKNSKEYFHFEK
ncbi:MAG: glucuronate isomerase [Spirochaetaceae bacterium]|jgi:glucuronate isomerase|nr:glucuronate isomerase [Spirochaetaceae bacterium]